MILFVALACEPTPTQEPPVETVSQPSFDLERGTLAAYDAGRAFIDSGDYESAILSFQKAGKSSLVSL